MNNDSFRRLFEKVSAETEVYQIKLPVKDTDLSPVFSKESIDLHYGTLYKNYVTKAHEGEGEFQVAGAKLHTLFFEQFQIPKTNNEPTGAFKLLIEKKYDSYERFKDFFTKEALSIQGSGWVYVDTSGNIKTIANHKIVSNVAVLFDMWEHSFIIDHGADRKKYIKDMWKVINWSIINARLN